VFFHLQAGYYFTLRTKVYVVQTGPRANPASCPMGKRPGREGDNSPPTTAEVKNTCIYKSTPIRFHGVVLNELSTRKTLHYVLSYFSKN
jgi:hypothetical protein